MLQPLIQGLNCLGKFAICETGLTKSESKSKGRKTVLFLLFKTELLKKLNPKLTYAQRNPMNKPTPKQRKANLIKWHKAIQKEIADYMKAKTGEIRKNPVYLEKDSDKAVDSMRATFDLFVSETYRDDRGI